jgi:UDP-2,3-diacylglucosamine hydrolase
MSTLFISDLHLSDDRPHITRLFIDFLEYKANSCDALYILGDLFELWVGDDDLTPGHQQVISALHTFSQTNIPLYFVHGNRDFLISKGFAKQSGCHLLSETTVIDLYGTPTLLLHGDTLCTDDQGYIEFRKKARNPILQKLFLMKSLDERKKLAAQVREYGKTYTASTPMAIMDANMAEIMRVMTQHHVSHMIHGHTHRPTIQHMWRDQLHYQRIVLADWHTRSHVLAVHPNGIHRLIDF